MDLDEIRTRLYKTVDAPNSQQSVLHLMWRLMKEDPETVLTALLGVYFEDSGYRVQENAGGLLWRLKPKYTRNLGDDVKRSLKYWNVSVEELPWYLAETVGIERVRAEANAILSAALDEISNRAAETYLYWLKDRGDAAKDHFEAGLDQKWEWLGG